MPIATPQGTLDFKSVDKVTFVGASSNTVIDTTTGSLGVGVGVSGPTSNLHVVGNTRLEGDINMLHTANTASIKLNSNVVTEFPRSKKLVKYPRVNLTSAANNAYENGYKITFSSSGSWSGKYAFDGIVGSTSGSLWYTGELSHYTGADGEAASTAPLLDTNTDRGQWLGIELPVAIKLQYFYLWQQPNDVQHFPKSGTIYAKKQTNDPWVEIYRYDNRTRTHEPDVPEIFSDVNSEVAYKYFVLVCTKRLSQNLSPGYGVALGEWQLFGVPEYDPDAHGTDVVVKSVPNVPNTDWLEVYYDAKNYSGVGNVQDETTNNRDGTLYGNASLNSADGIHKFDFDGNGDYIKTTLTGFTGKTVTFSAWVFMNSVDTSRVNTIMGLGSWGGTGSAAWIAVGTNGVLETGNKSITNCGGSVQANTLTGRWLHITGIVSSGDFRFYQDGQLIKSLTTTGTIDYGTNPVLYIATRADSSGNPEATRYFDCKIANARLFSRALTTDEIYQLYAYQKEYFGHGDLSMTLKAGRLGIGTSEPRGVLDVRGDMYGGCPVFFTAYAGDNGTVTGSSAGTVIVFNTTTVNKGGAYDTSNGRCTFPVSGYYEVFFRGGTAGTADFHAKIYRNGNAPGSGGWPNHVSRLWDAADSTYRNAGTIQFFDYFEAGEYIEVRLTNFSVFNADNYNSFSVKYLSN